MAVFFTNICKYDTCGRIFSSLSDLICHIEETHLDFDPQVIEEKEKQRPHMLPLSYVLRYNNEDVSNKKSVEKETRDVDVNTTNTVLPENPAVYEPPSTSKPITDMDDEDIICCESEGSLDSFTIEDTVHEHLVPLESYNKVASYNVEHVKPYACLIPGCHKRYKNINGMRYHSKHGHSGCNNKSKKDFSCFCGKNYKTIYGLKTHKMIHQNYGFEPKRSSHKENKPSKTSTTPRILAKLDKNEKKVTVKHAIGYKDPNVITSPFSSPPPNNIFCYKPSSDCNFFPDYASKF